MARPPSLLLKREDYSEVKEDWIDRFIRTLNLFGRQTTAALSRGITFGDNVNAFVKSFASTKVPLVITNDLPSKGKPVGVLLLSAAEEKGGSAVSLGSPAWKMDSKGLTISSMTGMDADKKYDLTFLVIGG